MRKFLITLTSFAWCLVATNLKAQPYIDLLNTRYSYSPNTGTANETNVPVKMQYFNISTNLPIRFKKSGDAILINPLVESWKIAWPDKNYKKRDLEGFALPVGFLKNFGHSKFSLLGMFIPRINKEKTASENNHFFQFGGFLLGSIRLNDRLSLKAGAYYNQEFFGPFFIPLLGIDWKINGKTNLFGTLPNQLVFERKINSRVYVGGITRFVTNSYRLASQWSNQEYLRIDENQIGGFADFYLTKKLIANFEFGHSVARKIKENAHRFEPPTQYDLHPKDNFYMKLALAYRIRFR